MIKIISSVFPALSWVDIQLPARMPYPIPSCINVIRLSLIRPSWRAGDYYNHIAKPLEEAIWILVRALYNMDVPTGAWRLQSIKLIIQPLVLS